MKIIQTFVCMALGLALPRAVWAVSYDQAMASCQNQMQKYLVIIPKGNFQCVDKSSGNGTGYVWLRESQIGAMVGIPYSPSDKLALAISPEKATIPANSGVVKGKVLTKSILGLSLKKGTEGVAGKQLKLISDRGAVDLFAPVDGLVTTGPGGVAASSVSTRLQPGSSTITAENSDISTKPAGSIAWLPAKFENSFLVTCYTIANEADWAPTPASTNVCGLPEDKNYSTRFLKDVRMQGSGVALDGTIIHYNAHQSCYNTESCARTATGACAVPGTTIAVDFSVIPRRSTVDVAIIGERKAQDTGGRIKGYHIDEYVGAQPKMCRTLGLRNSAITLKSY